MGGITSVFMTQAQKEELHKNMTIKGWQIEARYLQQSERIGDLTCYDQHLGQIIPILPEEEYAQEKAQLERIEQESIMFLKEWKDLGLPLRDDGKVQLFPFKNF